jgi:hypothetical protein
MVQALIIEGWMAQILGLLLLRRLLSRREYSTANRLLAFGLSCAVFRQAILTLQLSGTLENFPILSGASFPVQMVGIPTFSLYVTALTTPDFRIERNMQFICFHSSSVSLFFLSRRCFKLRSKSS